MALAFACEGEGKDPKAQRDARSDAPAGGPTKEGGAAEVPLPAAAELFSAHVEATGGRARIEALSSLHIESEIEVREGGLRGQVDFWWQDGRFRLSERIEGLGVSEVGYDGERYWIRDAYAGLREPSAEEAELYARGTSPFLIAAWRDFFVRVETIGVRESEGRKLFDVRALTPKGQELVLSFDATTDRLFAIAYDEPKPDGARRVTTICEDYREQGGLSFAHRRRSRTAAGEIVQTLRRVEVDPRIPPESLAPPAPDPISVDPTAQIPLSLDEP